MGLPIQWLSHLKDREAKDEFAKTVRNSTAILDRLRDIIDRMSEEIGAYEVSIDNFTTAEFASRQAFLLGQRKVLADIRRLVDINK